MLGVLLTILKVLLWIILSILGLVLLILILVLFWPFVYKISASYYDDIDAKFSVTWLVVKAAGTFTKDDGLFYKVTALGIPIKSSDDESGDETEDELNIDTEAVKSDQAQETVADTTLDNIKGSDVETGKEIIKEPINDSNDFSDDELDELLKDFESEDGVETEISEEKESFSAKIEKFKAKYKEIRTKIDHVLQFLDKPYTQKTIELVKKYLVKILKEFVPSRAKGNLHIGMSNPADTGFVVGILAAVRPIHKKWLNVMPDFENKVIEGDIYMKGYIRLWFIVYPVLRVYFDKNFKKTYALFKKI